MTKEYKTVKLSELTPYKNNPRKNDQAVPAVKESIAQCGYINPIVVDENYEIMAGHTRYKALRENEADEVEVLVVSGLTDAQKRKYRLLDNKSAEAAEWDYNLLSLELEDLDFSGFDFGFDDVILDDGYGTEFELPDGEKSEIVTMTFTLHEEQKGLIEYALSQVENEITETFGNTNKNGNALYEVIKQWAESRT